MAQKVINTDANERAKPYLECGKASHEITAAAPSSYAEQCKILTVRSIAGWATVLLICQFILEHKKTTTNTEKCIPLFLRKGETAGDRLLEQ